MTWNRQNKQYLWSEDGTAKRISTVTANCCHDTFADGHKMTQTHIMNTSPCVRTQDLLTSSRGAISALFHGFLVMTPKRSPWKNPNREDNHEHKLVTVQFPVSKFPLLCFLCLLTIEHNNKSRASVFCCGCGDGHQISPLIRKCWCSYTAGTGHHDFVTQQRHAAICV